MAYFAIHDYNNAKLLENVDLIMHKLQDSLKTLTTFHLYNMYILSAVVHVVNIYIAYMQVLQLHL